LELLFRVMWTTCPAVLGNLALFVRLPAVCLAGLTAAGGHLPVLSEVEGLAPQCL